jgi:putative transposase
MCQVLGVSKSGYYAWLKRPKREKGTADPTDSERVSQVTQDLRKSENYARTTQTRNSCVLKDSRSYHE